MFDEQFKYVPEGSGFIQAEYYSDRRLQTLATSGLPVVKSGYLFVYLSYQAKMVDGEKPVFFDNLVIQHYTGPLSEENVYYPFGLLMAGISSKAIGRVENKYKYNGIEYEKSFDINLGETFYRSHDPQLGRWWQIDPKPNEMFSPYAAMNNNPLLLSDPMGDTTWVYNTNGVFCGVVNDKLKNQVHYIKTDGDPGQPFDGSKFSAKDANAMGKQFRKVSVAFIGSKTISDMRSIVNKSVAAKVEVGFVGVVGNDKEIRLKALPIDGSNHINSVDVRTQVNSNYTSDEQKALFLEGHTHIANYVNKVIPGDGSPMAWQKGTGNPSKPEDYTPALDRGTQKGVPGNAPSMVATPYGVTLYGTGTMTPYGQPSPNNTYLLYKSLK